MQWATVNRRGAAGSSYSIKSTAKAAILAALVAMSFGGYAHAADADMPTKAPPKPKPTPQASFFVVNDTAVSGIWYFNYQDPGVSGSENTVPGGLPNAGNSYWMAQGAIDHFDLWEYGATLIHVEVNQYAPQEPAGGTPGAAGSREFFSFAQETLSGNALTHSKIFDTPITNDIGPMVRLTAGVQNQFLSEQTTQYAVGANIDFKLPKILGGSFQFGITAYKEFSRNAYDACGLPGFGVVNGPAAAFSDGANTCIGGGSFSGNRDWEWTWKIFTFYSLPLGGLLGEWADSARIINILNVTGPKGTGISTANCLALGCFSPVNGALITNETKTEVFEDARLTFDTSKLFWGKPGIWDTFVGYRYWYNMYGTNHNAPLFAGCASCFNGGPFGAPGTSIMSTAYVGMTYHFK
jgi:hypothetical protein